MHQDDNLKAAELHRGTMPLQLRTVERRRQEMRKEQMPERSMAEVDSGGEKSGDSGDWGKLGRGPRRWIGAHPQFALIQV